MSDHIRYFWDIPIYRCDPKTYEQQIELDREKYLAEFPPEQRVIQKDHSTAAQWYAEKYWAPWKFNQIIGWLCLWSDGGQIRVDLFLSDAKRFTLRATRKRYLYRAQILLIDGLREQASSSPILDAIVEHIKILGKRRDLKGRYIDIEYLIQVGRFVNWNALLGIE